MNTILSLAPQPEPQPETWRPIGDLVAQIVADLRFRRQCEQLHRKGPRALAEFLAELAARHSLTRPMKRQLERYREIDDRALELTAGDRFAPVPLHEVGNDRG